MTYVGAVLAVWTINGRRIYGTPEILFVASLAIIGGSILGYVTGGLIGAVFLIADKLRNAFARRRKVARDLESSRDGSEPDAPARATL